MEGAQLNLGPHSSLSAPGGNMGLREPEGAAEEGAEARAPEASMAGEAWAGEDLKSRFGTPRGRGAPHPLAPAREHLGGEKRKGQRWVAAVRGDGEGPRPSPTRGTRGPPASYHGGRREGHGYGARIGTATEAAARAMARTSGPWRAPQPRHTLRGHSECLGARLRAMGSASGCMASTPGPRQEPQQQLQGYSHRLWATASTTPRALAMVCTSGPQQGPR